MNRNDKAVHGLRQTIAAAFDVPIQVIEPSREQSPYEVPWGALDNGLGAPISRRRARRIRWVGPRHYKKGRLEVGRLWIVWAGWHPRKAFNIGSTRVVPVGPLGVFVHAPAPRRSPNPR